jgi:hypothetical protein
MWLWNKYYKTLQREELSSMFWCPSDLWSETIDIECSEFHFASLAIDLQFPD